MFAVSALLLLLNCTATCVPTRNGMLQVLPDHSESSATRGQPVGKNSQAFGKDVSPPRVKYQTEPEYSREGRQDGIEGAVVIRALVGADGKIHDPVVVKSLGHGLDEQAVQAVKQWLFDPAKKNGSPVAVYADKGILSAIGC